MSTQLRLVENLPEAGADHARDLSRTTAREVAPTLRAKPTPSSGRRARAAGAGRARRARWDSDWRLDTRSRTVGRQGIAAARAALERSTSTRLPAA